MRRAQRPARPTILQQGVLPLAAEIRSS